MKLPTPIVSRLLEKSLGYEDIPGPRSYPLVGNVFGYKAPGVGRDVVKTL